MVRGTFIGTLFGALETELTYWTYKVSGPKARAITEGIQKAQKVEREAQGARGVKDSAVGRLAALNNRKTV